MGFAAFRRDQRRDDHQCAQALANISDDVLLLPKVLIEPICELKVHGLGGHNPRLRLDEILVALSISAVTNPLTELAMAQLPKLRGFQSRSSVILAEVV